MKYLENADERLVAMKSPKNDDIYGVLYINQHGAFVRINRTWTAVGPSDQAFSGAVPFNVIATTAQEFIDTYDGGNVTLNKVKKYLEPVT